MASHPGDRGLTERQARFARHYVSTRNATASARLAGYAAPHSPVGCKLLKIAAVSQEVARLAQAHAREAGAVLRDAVNSAARLAPLDQERDTIAAQLLQEMSEQVAATLARHWVTSTMVRNLKMAMGEIPSKVSTVRTRKQGLAPVVQTVETYRRDPAAAVSTARLLFEELDRQDKAALSTAEVQAGNSDSAHGDSRSLGTRLLERHLAAFRRPGEPGPDDDADSPSATPEA